MPPVSDHDSRCSFCNRPSSEAGALVAGTDGAFTCRDCVRRLFSERVAARHQPKPIETSPLQVNRTYSGFTDRARLALTLAQEEAQRFNHHYIGTEHLLLGLIRVHDGVAARALSSLGIKLPRVRRVVEFIISHGEGPVVGQTGITPRAKKVLALAVDEARRLGHDYVGTEHLLLGSIREGKGVAAGVLENLDVTLDKARAEVIKVLAQRGAREDT